MSAWYDNYAADYKRYARMRGFHSGFNNWAYHRRGFLECWAEPGFHRFWQVWNPGISYFVYQIFIRLGGRKHWIAPTLLAFFLCGLIHTLIVVPFVGRWSFSVIVAFTCFGVLTVTNRLAEPVLQQRRWPMPVNVLLNMFLVAASFDVGFKVNRLLGF